ncbi:MAG: hypothetical protein L3J41_06790 [Melioribacteraceae bacterium]|nr:hypothetical protein [Melioribacteraceae bacterium]
MKNLKYYVFIIAAFFAVTVNAQYGINVKGGAYIPYGEFADRYTTGVGGELTFVFVTNPNFEFGFTTGYSRYSADKDALHQSLMEDLEDLLGQMNIDAIINVEAPLNIIPLVLNIKYLFGSKKFKPYLCFEGGLFFYELTTKGNVEVVNGPTIDIQEYTEQSNSTMLGIGGGMQFRLTKKIFFDISAKWSIMNNIRLVEADVNEEKKGIDKTVQTIGLLGGFSYYF